MFVNQGTLTNPLRPVSPDTRPTTSSYNAWDMRSTFSSSSRSVRPFALDFEDDENSLVSRASLESRGYRDGGPKQARLHRVALLSKTKDVDHMHPVKVENIPRNASPQKLKETFSAFGEVGDVYIPTNYKDGKPLKNFAIIRFEKEDSLDKLIQASPPSSPTTTLSLDGRPLTASPLRSQKSFFTKGTGYHGICNEPVEDGTYNRDAVQVQQDITLSSCLSRCGYPWGSVRELKVLTPHLPQEATETFPIRIENLDTNVTAEEIKEEFERRYVKVFVVIVSIAGSTNICCCLLIGNVGFM